MPMTWQRRELAGQRAPISAALLVVGAAISQEVGAAYAVGLFAALGAIGAVFTRSLVAGVILGIAVRPRLRGLSRRAWGSAAALAATLTVMNLCFYSALSRIPLGVAVTIEALGPLVLSVVVSARRIAWLWAVLAFSGVALLGLSQQRAGGIDPVGCAFAVAAGVSWAAYILASSRAAAQFRRVDGLAVATMLGAAATAPIALVSIDHAQAATWRVLVLAVTVGVLSSVIPYSLELLSLRRLPPATFAILTCLSPVVAALAGWIVLEQQLGLVGYLAIGLVTGASVGAVRSAHAARAPAR